ncbi:MAG TPA: hypothetical protein VF220_02880, partial [Nitrososphaeraceae archaeon]
LNVNAVILFQHTILYSILVALSLATQIFFLISTTRIVFKIKKVTSRRAKLITYIYIVSQVVVMLLLAYLLVEQLTTFRYHTILSDLIVGVSLIVSVVILMSLGFKCVKAYLSTRNKVVGVYGLALLIFSVQLIAAFSYVEANLYKKPEYVTAFRNPWASSFYSSLQSKLLSIYEITKSISFIAVWIASVLLTIQYAQKTGKIKYWITVCIPLIYFLFQYSPLLFQQIGTLSALMMREGSLFVYFYNFILNTVTVGTGVLFGISFFILSRHLIHEQLKYYLIVCGTGFMIILGSSLSTTLVLAPFPAWGIVSLSFILPASFLILIGLDSATFYFASEMSVRRYLTKSRSQFELLLSLGSAEMSASIQRKIDLVSKTIQDDLETETLLKARSESEEIKHYVIEVIAEMKKTRTKSGI